MTLSFDQIEDIWIFDEGTYSRLIPSGFTGLRRHASCRAKHTWIRAADVSFNNKCKLYL